MAKVYSPDLDSKMTNRSSYEELIVRYPPGDKSIKKAEKVIKNEGVPEKTFSISLKKNSRKSFITGEPIVDYDTLLIRVLSIIEVKKLKQLLLDKTNPVAMRTSAAMSLSESLEGLL